MCSGTKLEENELEIDYGQCAMFRPQRTVDGKAINKPDGPKRVLVHPLLISS